MVLSGPQLKGARGSLSHQSLNQSFEQEASVAGPSSPGQNCWPCRVGHLPSCHQHYLGRAWEIPGSGLPRIRGPLSNQEMQLLHHPSEFWTHSPDTPQGEHVVHTAVDYRPANVSQDHPWCLLSPLLPSLRAGQRQGGKNRRSKLETLEWGRQLLWKQPGGLVGSLLTHLPTFDLMLSLFCRTSRGAG